MGGWFVFEGVLFEYHVSSPLDFVPFQCYGIVGVSWPIGRQRLLWSTTRAGDVTTCGSGRTYGFFVLPYDCP